MININNNKHKIIKLFKNIINNKKFRLNNKLIIGEGWNMFKQIIDDEINIKILLITNENIEKINILKYKKIEKIYIIDKKIMQEISNVELTQGILFAIQSFNIDSINELNLNDDIILMDKIQDPGNLGTMLRTAAAFNIKNIILTNYTTDYTSPKVIRSTAGSIFKLKIFVSNDIYNILNFLKKINYKVLSTSLTNTNNDINIIKLKQKKIVIFGNESNGISNISKENSDFIIKIPIENVNSLNVAISSGIIMYLMKNGEINNNEISYS